MIENWAFFSPHIFRKRSVILVHCVCVWWGKESGLLAVWRLIPHWTSLLAKTPCSESHFQSLTNEQAIESSAKRYPCELVFCFENCSWTYCVRKKLSNYLEKLEKTWEFAQIFRSQGQFIQIVKGQNNFSNKIQSNLAIRNFLVALKSFLNAKSSLSLWSKGQIGHRKWFLNTKCSLSNRSLLPSLTVKVHRHFMYVKKN